MQVADALYFSIYLGPCMLLHYRSPRLVILLGFIFHVDYTRYRTVPFASHFSRATRIHETVNVAATVLTRSPRWMPSGHMAATLYGFTSLHALPPRLSDRVIVTGVRCDNG
jgi:membrane-associated phospholipid phosphatase